MIPVDINDLDDRTLDIIVDTVPLSDITAAVKSADPEWHVTTLIAKAVAAAISDRDLTIAQKDLSLNVVSETLRQERDVARAERAALWGTLKRLTRRSVAKRSGVTSETEKR